MAAVFVPPSPRTSLNMSTRRPLANVPNATNSPHRAGLVPAKRARPGQIEIPYGQPPPKKQVMDTAGQDTRSPTRSRSTAHHGTESKLFTRRSNNAIPSAFEKKLVAAREKERQAQLKKSEKPDTLDTIRVWQRHYRKAFPQFVFYFDSIPEDVRRRLCRQVVALGAREEKFFSRMVTHIVTSRPIPPEATTPTEDSAPATARANVDAHMQTVNPSLLEKTTESHLHVSLKNDARRDQNMDVLQRARQMGMKIWALEKLQRMISTINDNEIGGQHDSTSRSKSAGGTAAQDAPDDALTRLLRSEAVNGPSDRDPLSSMEMIMFKGPFIYIHDMNEKTKPVMVREYPKVHKRQDGAWPQFRSAPLGKCPFMDESPSRKDSDRHRMREAHKEKKATLQAAEEVRTKPSAGLQRTAGMKLVTGLGKPQRPEGQHRASKPEVATKSVFEETHERKSSESFIPPHFPRTGPFYTGREPAASGVQPSNVTSAIRSQMISSTAAAAGAKAGLSKEVHGLKRKVLEKGTGNIAPGSMAAPQRPSNGSAASTHHQNRRNMPTPVGKNGHGLENNTNQSEAAGTKRRRDDRRDSEQKKPEQRRDPKPGYCENCQDKFDDFEEHITTRKHRRFAQNPANWAELDTLLFDLQRPLREEDESDY